MILYWTKVPNIHTRYPVCDIGNCDWMGLMGIISHSGVRQWLFNSREIELVYSILLKLKNNVVATFVFTYKHKTFTFHVQIVPAV